MSFEDIYYWKKNGRPEAEKDHEFNSACHYKMRNLKTECAIIKTYHIEFGEGKSGKQVHRHFYQTVLQQDIAPYVRYSANKKKRWEVNVGADLLGELQKMHIDMEVLLMERARFMLPPYIGLNAFPNYYFHKYPIQQLHSLDSDGIYTCTTVNSILGQKFENFAHENRSHTKVQTDFICPNVAESPKVAYHFISPPKNYEVFLHKRFHPGRLKLKWWYCKEYPTIRRATDFRDFIEEDLFEFITYDALMDMEWDDIHEWDEDDEEDDSREHPRECYHLEDILVDNWMIVKRRKNRIAGN